MQAWLPPPTHGAAPGRLTCCIVCAAGVTPSPLAGAAPSGTSASAAKGEGATGPGGRDTPVPTSSGASACWLPRRSAASACPVAPAAAAAPATEPSRRAGGGKQTNSKSREGAMSSTAPVLPDSR